MLILIKASFDGANTNIQSKIVGMYVLLSVATLVLCTVAVTTFSHYPVLLGTAFLAYSFGLRHAVDADHIAAIDNVTRKLMQQGKRPVGVGFFFSLGHSTIVFGLSAAVAIMALAVKNQFGAIESLATLSAQLSRLVS